MVGLAILGLLFRGIALAEECTGTLTAEEAVQAEDARYTAQTSNDFAAMERLFGDDLVYIQTTALVDGKDSYVESMRSGRVKYRVMGRSDVKVRTYGCLAIITGLGNFEVTAPGQDVAVEMRFHSMAGSRRCTAISGIWTTRVPCIGTG